MTGKTFDEIYVSNVRLSKASSTLEISAYAASYTVSTAPLVRRFVLRPPVYGRLLTRGSLRCKNTSFQNTGSRMTRTAIQKNSAGLRGEQ